MPTTTKTITQEVIPSWFRLGAGLNQTHHTDPQFPRGFTPPNNKIFWGQNIMPHDVQADNGKNVLLNCGLTQVGFNTNPVEGLTIPKANLGLLYGDSGYADLSKNADGTSNSTKTERWNYTELTGFSYSHRIVIFDWENFGYADAPGIPAKLVEANNICTANGCLFGLWANGLVNIPSLAIGGVTNSTSLASWDTAYNSDPNSKNNFLIKNSGAKFSNNYHYHAAYMTPNLLYQTMVAHELGKLIDPTVLTVPAIWVVIEHIDGLRFQERDLIKPNGTVKYMQRKLSVPACQVYADALWGMVWDGWYHFETGRLHTENKAYAHNEWNTPYEDALLTNIVNVRGINTFAANKDIYYGFYNYVHLALWQMSQSHIKPIIEHLGTSWTSPEYNVFSGAMNSSNNNIWRTGNEIRPHYGLYYKDPIVKYKMSGDGTKVLVMAQNPCNTGTQNIKIRNNSSGWEVSFNLKRGWPYFGVIAI